MNKYPVTIAYHFQNESSNATSSSNDLRPPQFGSLLENVETASGKVSALELNDHQRFDMFMLIPVDFDLQGDPSGWFKPPVNLHLGCSVNLPGQ